MHFSTDGFDTLFIFAVAIAAYAVPDLLGGNGYLSAYIVGIMLDTGNNVMKTFNDYSEGTEMQFGRIDIGPGSKWNGKKVMDLGLPGNMLIALVIRGKERITARGDTVLQAGDRVILVTKTYEDTETYEEPAEDNSNLSKRLYLGSKENTTNVTCYSADSDCSL